MRPVSFVLSTALGFFIVAAAAPAAASDRRPASRTLAVTYTAAITNLPAEAQRIEAWIPLPRDDEDQRILDMRVDSPYPSEVTHDPDWGNAILHVVAPPGRSAFTVRVHFTVERRESWHKPIPPVDPSDLAALRTVFIRALRPTRMAIQDERVRAFARQAVEGRVQPDEQARAIYDWVLANMEYNKTVEGWGRGDVVRACLAIEAAGTGKDAGKGNCTDFHSLFGSLARSLGIPVKFIMGFPFTPGKDNPKGKVGGYHCWAKFFLPGAGWVPVDISEADKDPSKSDYFFGAICENRVAFSVGRDILLTPPQQGERLNYFGPDPYVEVDGQPHTHFTRSIAWTTPK
ncbi:MAG: transglutaminase domain-containing protein [Nitrospinota bacterium]